MATQSERGLKYSLEQMSARINGRIKDATIGKLQRETQELKELLDDSYEDFFNTLVSRLIGHGDTIGGSAPPLIARHLGGEASKGGGWKRLSPSWVDRKTAASIKYDIPEGYYQGLTRALGAVSTKRLGRTKLGASRTKAARPGATSRSFQQYMTSLATSPGSTARFFGPLEVTYAFAKDGRSFKQETVNGVIRDIDAISEKTGKFLMLPREFSVKSTITAFPKLRGVEFSEWYVVDYILKRIDPGNEKQWVKINGRRGFGKSNRPIRAMITPLISWYFNVEFAAHMRAYQGRLRSTT